MEHYFHGSITRDTVKTLLKNDGDFLTREKSDGSGRIVLSIFWKEVKNFNVDKDEQVIQLSGSLDEI